MPFSEVSLYNFRNIKNQKLPVHYEQVFFVGENGQGKTNFLEALYLLAYGRSFRVHRDTAMVTIGCDDMAVSAKWYPAGENQINTDIAIKYAQKKKEIRLNNTLVHNRKELLEYIPVIIFSHDDIVFVNGAAENKRWFFNQCLSRYHLDFIDILHTYTKILKTRNEIIKSRNLDLIDIYNRQLAENGSVMMQQRRNLVLEFNKIFTPLFRTISGVEEPIFVEYQPSWNADDRDSVMEILESRVEMDIHLGTTTSGPHRDKFSFRINDRDFLYEASTGQLRLMSLILRIAQAQLYAQKCGRKPVLLIDDVLLEVDTIKREKLIAELPEYDQIFFTFLPDENISRYERKNFISFQVNNGEYKVMHEKSG